MRWLVLFAGAASLAGGDWARAGPAIQITQIAGEVRATDTTPATDCYKDFFTSLPVNRGIQRGYSSTRAPQADLKTARSTIYRELNASLAPADGWVYYQNYNSGGYKGRNIIGVLPGRGAAVTDRYILGAHYDSVQNPGADDNATGVAGVLEAARVLSRHRFGATILFMAFDGEELRTGVHTLGSQAYANWALAQGTRVKGMVSMDMIGYNAGNHSIAEIGLGHDTISSTLQNQVYSAFTSYTHVNAQTLAGLVGSDHDSFAADGMPAVLLCEQTDSFGDLLNPYYHTWKDYYLDPAGHPQQAGGRNYIDVNYATDMTRGAVAWAATQAGPLDPKASLQAHSVPEPHVGSLIFGVIALFLRRRAGRR